MDAQRLDRLARSLIGGQTRRRLLGLGAGGLLGGLRWADSKGKKKRKRKCKKCGPCEKCKKGRCNPQPDDTACQGTGKCLNGQCNPLPICVRPFEICPPAGSTVSCCSGRCEVHIGCAFSDPGELCMDSDGCFEGVCVGYRCQAA